MNESEFIEITREEAQDLCSECHPGFEEIMLTILPLDSHDSGHVICERVIVRHRSSGKFYEFIRKALLVEDDIELFPYPFKVKLRRVHPVEKNIIVYE